MYIKSDSNCKLIRLFYVQLVGDSLFDSHLNVRDSVLVGHSIELWNGNFYFCSEKGKFQFLLL